MCTKVPYANRWLASAVSDEAARASGRGVEVDPSMLHRPPRRLARHQQKQREAW